MNAKLGRARTVRLTEEMERKIAALMARNNNAEADILRWALAAGLPFLENGQYNPATGTFAETPVAVAGAGATNPRKTSAGGSSGGGYPTKRQAGAKSSG